LADNSEFSDIFNAGDGDDTIILSDGAILDGANDGGQGGVNQGQNNEAGGFALGQGADGGDGSDTIDFTSITSSGITFDLGADTASIVTSDGTHDIAAANFENAVGTSGDDTFTTTAGANVIVGGDGDDEILITTTAVAADVFIGGEGTDTITNLSDEDLIFADFNPGDADEVLNGSGFEILNLGATTIEGTDDGGVFDFSTTDVNQIALGGTLLIAGDGDDDVTGVTGLVTIETTTGGFSPSNDVGFDLGAGDDTFTGTDANIDDTVDGGTGDDTIDGGTGNDTLIGGAGADTLNGGIGSDQFLVNSGDDSETDIFRRRWNGCDCQ